jgi:hypothetical protein
MLLEKLQNSAQWPRAAADSTHLSLVAVLIGKDANDEDLVLLGELLVLLDAVHSLGGRARALLQPVDNVRSLATAWA